MYFNQLNLALRSSPAVKGARAGSSGRIGLSRTLKALLNRVHADLAEGQLREIVLKSRRPRAACARLLPTATYQSPPIPYCLRLREQEGLYNLLLRVYCLLRPTSY